MKLPSNQYQLNKYGGASMMVLIFGAIAILVIASLVVFTAMQHGFSSRGVASEQALMIAEAGINYYRWHLAHDPNDFTDGTGQLGPYVHDFADPQGGVVGQYSLEIIPPGDGYTAVTLISTGWTNRFPTVKRTVKVRFGIPSLARYSFLHNSNVWFGAGITVHGRVLSNGGIRQDGVNDSVIQSAQVSYLCGTETGCDPPEIKDGVWGTGGPSNFWEYPVPPADFDGISVDFATMRDAADALGTHLNPSNHGYHFIFNADGIVDVYNVTRTRSYRGYDDEDGCSNLYQRIQQESLVGSYDLATNNIFFVEDTVWVEGVVNGRATIAAARFPIDSFAEDIWIRDNLVYFDKNGDHNLGLIAQDDIYFVKDLPDYVEVDAAMLAQKGQIVRHHYKLDWCGNYPSNAVRERLTIFGSVVSNQRSYWNWGDGPESGFIERDITYDSNLLFTPPPYFPASGDYEYLSWEEDAHD